MTVKRMTRDAKAFEPSQHLSQQVNRYLTSAIGNPSSRLRRKMLDGTETCDNHGATVEVDCGEE